MLADVANIVRCLRSRWPDLTREDEDPLPDLMERVNRNPDVAEHQAIRHVIATIAGSWPTEPPSPRDFDAITPDAARLLVEFAERWAVGAYSSTVLAIVMAWATL